MMHHPSQKHNSMFNNGMKDGQAFKNKRRTQFAFVTFLVERGAFFPVTHTRQKVGKANT